MKKKNHSQLKFDKLSIYELNNNYKLQLYGGQITNSPNPLTPAPSNPISDTGSISNGGTGPKRNRQY